MDRRESLKLMLLTAAGPGHILDPQTAAAVPVGFASPWHDWPDIRWAGPGFWGNRLQDWEVHEGTLRCRTRGPGRTLHLLTHRATALPYGVGVQIAVPSQPGPDTRVGFRLGGRGRFDDYRSAAVHGTGLDVGLTGTGALFIGNRIAEPLVDPSVPVRLEATASRRGGVGVLELAARVERGGPVQASLQVDDLDSQHLLGNLALLSDFSAGGRVGPAARFAEWDALGPGIDVDPDRAYGPIMFAQYTLHRGVLKLTAQMAPVEQIPGVTVGLEVRSADGAWSVVDRSNIDPLSRTARFRVSGWDASKVADYRVSVVIPLRSGPARYEYRGTIAAEPKPTAPVKAAVFSCNADHGFPDNEVVRHVSVHEPDLCLFLGDQFYEGSGGFGIQTDSVAEAALDMLHKWYMFGWSYRDLFRDVPAAFIPDDHDVYHGNVWGEGGKAAPTDQGWGAVAQDQGGYKMPAAWVNCVQMAQTSHLPDPHDPTPVEQGIGVYYTSWDYGGISFAILEDRKFKSAPANVLPAEAEVFNGWIQNPEFDIREHDDPPGAHLLGPRQMSFLEEWAQDWSGGAYVKIVLSQTNFAAVHTIPESAMSGSVLPDLPMPAPGEYVLGDKLAVDMDSNGWPRARRDEVLRLLRKCAAVHVAGDQHLATVVRHGVDSFRDAIFSFTGPALNNIWPRRWWPAPVARERALPDGPAYTGDFFDGFGNRITVFAAANPRATGLEPSIIRDRVTGYGMVSFDATRGLVRIDCWPRHANPRDGAGGQYEGWPVEIDLHRADGRVPDGVLRIDVHGLENPVAQLFAGGSLEYARRCLSSSFTVPIHGPAPHVLRVGDPDADQWIEHTVRPTDREGERIRLDFRR